MNAKQIVSELNARGAEFIIHTNIMYGKGINGIGFDSYCPHEEFNSGTEVFRTFEPNDNYLLIIENYEPKGKEPFQRKKYIGYDKITYINEIVED